MSDLPPLPDDADVDALEPEAFLERPHAEPGDLTLESLTPVRAWLTYLQESPHAPLKVTPLPDEVIDVAIASLTCDYRRQGIDLYDPHELLAAYWSHQVCIIALLGDLSECGGGPGDVLHTYVHICRPMANLALSFELLLVAVFGDEAALPGEGG